MPSGGRYTEPEAREEELHAARPPEPSPPAGGAELIHALQRGAGNHAVTRMLAREPETETAEAAAAPVQAAELRSAGDTLTGERISITDDLLALISGSMSQPKVLGKHEKKTELGDFGAKPLYFGGGPDPQDVRQGELGDCYLLAALAAVAKANPDVIRNMIKDNGDGTYDVTLYQDKAWFSKELKPTVVTVDAMFPQKKDGDDAGKPVYAQLGVGQMGIWVMLIEKAYAKLKGSYGSIVGGFGGPAMEAITGKESKRYEPKDYTDSNLFGIIESLLANDQALTASADWALLKSTKKEAMDEIGATLQHEYTVMSVDPAQKTVRLRNPWGHGNPIPLTMAQLKKWFNYIHANPAK